MSLSQSPEEQSLKSPPGRGLLFAGVAAAALMGVGLGLWARPAMSERQMAAPLPIEAPKTTPTRMLQIVVEDAPAVFGAPIEVLPATRAPTQAAPPPERLEPERLEPEPLAPVRPRSGLVRVQTVESEPIEAAPPPTAVRRLEPKPAPQELAAPKPVKIKPVAAPQPAPQKLAAPKPVKIKAVAAPKPAPEKLAAPKPVRVKAVPAPKAKPPLERAPKLEKVKAVEKTKAKVAVVKVATADPKPVKAGIRLAKADRPQKPARIEKAEVKRPAKLSGLVERIAQHKVAVTPKPSKPQKVKLETKKPRAIRPPVEKVAQQAKPAKAAPVKALKPAKGAGPVRLAKAQPRPDTAIRDADRQMNRAYSTARAAGVPDWQLRKQQARWEAARASAAREAPWAVHDVYLARIAELHDLTKDAQASGY